MTCLSSLSTHVGNARAYVDLYPGDDAPFAAVEGLYVALLESAESMMSWLDEPAWRISLVCHMISCWLVLTFGRVCSWLDLQTRNLRQESRSGDKATD